jgi:hypothetical protein
MAGFSFALDFILLIILWGPGQRPCVTPSNEKPPRTCVQGGFSIRKQVRLALTRLELLLCLVDHIHAAFAAHDLTVTVTLLERPERVSDLHRPSPYRGAQAPLMVVLRMQG